MFGGIAPGQYWPFAPGGGAAPVAPAEVHTATVAIYPTHTASGTLAAVNGETVFIYPLAGVSVLDFCTCDNDTMTADDTHGTADKASMAEV